jgi:hypothetical protein
MARKSKEIQQMKRRCFHGAYYTAISYQEFLSESVVGIVILSEQFVNILQTTATTFLACKYLYRPKIYLGLKSPLK